MRLFVTQNRTALIAKNFNKNIGDKFELSDLPPTNKREFMSHFDD